MDIVYSAANSLEAHMLKGVLEQHEIPAYISGEHLQSGFGEIPVMTGIVKISVDNANIIAAKKIIWEWEAAEKSQDSIDEKFFSSKKLVGTTTSFFNILLSLTVGAFCMFLYLKPTIADNSLDHNNDGIDDGKWTYSDNKAIKSEHDKNFDGKFDETSVYVNGLASVTKLDDNFDGKFDTELHYDYGNVKFSKSDTNFDGQLDLTIDYETNVNYKTSIFNQKTNLIKKIQFYKSTKLKKAELDTNDDGKMDVVIEYDDFEEEVSRKPIITQ